LNSVLSNIKKSNEKKKTNIIKEENKIDFQFVTPLATTTTTKPNKTKNNLHQSIILEDEKICDKENNNNLNNNYSGLKGGTMFVFNDINEAKSMVFYYYVYYFFKN
jgi:hypothetical protein